MRMKNPRLMSLTGVGLVVLLVAARELIIVRDFVSRAARARGSVVWVNTPGMRPEVRFQSQGGSAITYAQGGIAFGYHEGDAVDVLYDPREPVVASLDKFGALWGFPALFATLGLGIVALGWFTRK